MQNREIVENALEMIKNSTTEDDFSFALDILEKWANKSTIKKFFLKRIWLSPVIYDPRDFTRRRNVLITPNPHENYKIKFNINNTDLINKIEKYL